MFLADRLTLGTPRRTRDGFLVARARAARSGIYEYLGREVDPGGEHFAADEIVKVYRPEEEVFAADSVASFLMKPITNDHPSEPVTADNWKDHAGGVIAKALRDGDHLAFDLVMMDASLIADVEAGKRELSNGYASKLDFVAGDFNGEQYDARMSAIRGNHVAVVDKGRAGPSCRIADCAPCDSMAAQTVLDWLTDERTYTDHGDADKKARQRRETVDKGVGQVATETITLDGLKVDLTDAAATRAAIEKLQGQLADSSTKITAADQALKDEQAKLVERDATITAKDAKIAELEAKLADAAITPAKLQDAAKDYADVCGKAQALGVTFAEDADADAVKKAVVDAKMGDTAKDYDAAHVAIAFDALTKDAKVDPVRQVLAGGVKTNVIGRQAVDTARKAWLNDKAGAYRKPVAQGAK